MRGKMIGIDLGTTNSVVCIMEGKEPKVITNEEGGAITNPENTVYSIKRFMGRRFEETAMERPPFPYKIVEGPATATPVSSYAARVYRRPRSRRASSGKLKKARAEELPRREGDRGGHHRPGLLQRRAAPGDQGRRPHRRPSTSSASSTSRRQPLAYGLDKGKDHLIAVYDFGGGTFDISILEVGEKVVEVISTNGDTHLGGDDIDHRIIDWLVAEFKKDTGIDVSKRQDGRPAP